MKKRKNLLDAISKTLLLTTTLLADDKATEKLIEHKFEQPREKVKARIRLRRLKSRR